MAQPEISQSRLSIQYDNLLLVDGEFLQARDNPEFLGQVLKAGDFMIRAAIDEMYGRYSKTAPEVQRGSVATIRLAADLDGVITPDALEWNATRQSNRGVFSYGSMVHDTARPYWQAAEEAGFLPEIRTLQNPDKKLKVAGAALLVRDTPLKD